MSQTTWKKPTPEQIQAAHGKTVPDLLQPGLRVVWVGINPGLYSGAVGHHFARPGNRFWPVLHESGFTPERLHPSQERRLLEWGLGITNLVSRATARADELTADELVAGGQLLQKKLRRHRPRYAAFLGITAYRAAFGRQGTGAGPQTERIGDTPVWVLPNPSGLNAHYQRPDLVGLFGEFRVAAEAGVHNP